ncbi:hypothetical protein [Burkholderia sp. LMG 21824]|uniref:hypothetical protein n=1 Tax=Burkholderia sp. LMG 21824 TaxID=3158172 RepID=UPI003C2F4156
MPVAAELRLGDEATLPAPASSTSNPIRTTSRRNVSIGLDVMPPRGHARRRIEIAAWVGHGIGIAKRARVRRRPAAAPAA